MRNAAAKAVWPLCETPRATSMALVGVSRTKIPPYPPATASRGVPAPMSWRISKKQPVTTKELIGQIFKEPGIQFELSEFENLGRTVWQVFEEERPFLTAYRGPFDGFHATEVAVSKTCLVRFDNNQYSVAARAVRATGGRAGLC